MPIKERISARADKITIKGRTLAIADEIAIKGKISPIDDKVPKDNPTPKQVINLKLKGKIAHPPVPN
ncbi:hypothetical protein ACNSTQ_10225 [Alkalihalobacterium sp. APHAB7]